MQLRNISRSFHVLPNFPFTASETMCGWYLRVAERLKTYDLRKIGNIRKLSKLHRMIAQFPVP